MLEKNLTVSSSLIHEVVQMRSSAKPENKERVLGMAQMRLDGYSMRDIAEKYNVSKQYVQQELNVLSNGGRSYSGRLDADIIFPNLAKWMFENGMTISDLQEKMGYKSKNTALIRNRLYGYTKISMKDIKKILEITGQTFEYLFAERVVEDETE